jgi:hypothetical protein
MIYRITLFVLLFCGWAGRSMSQTYPRPEIQMEDFIENLFNLQSADANYEDLYEQLLLLYSNPIDLNDATADELRNTYILSEEQVQELLKRRQKTGKLLSIYELQSIPSFDLKTIYALTPFAVVNETPLNQDNKGIWKRIISEPNNSLILRASRTLEEQKGYTQAEPNANGESPVRYEGDPNKIFLRYRVSHVKDFSIGFTGEKDPGEKLKWNPDTKQYGLDFWSAHLMLENKGIFKKIVVGDYQYMFGQGLVYSAGFAVGKGSEPITTVRRSSIGIRPYTSVLEGLFFRGGAATIGFKNLEITALVSRKSVDGNIQSSSDTIDNDFIENFSSSINITGFHRTPTELRNKQSNREDMLGTSIIYKEKTGKWELGAMATTIQYQFPIIRRPTVYNQFDFNGDNNQNLSFSGQYNYQNFSFFGESALSKGGGHASVAGLVGSIGRGLDISMVGRNYSKDYHAFYSNGFGEATRNVNERGIYWGIKYRAHPKWLVAAYYDRFSFPYLAFQADGPSWGDEYLSRITFAPSRTTSFFIQYRNESKLRNLSGNDGLTDILVPTRRQNWVIQADAKATNWLSVRTRVQGSLWKQEKGKPETYGLAISQDLNLDFGKFSISNRFSLFDTDDFNNRQYLYEKNVLYAFSIPALNGRGVRVYSLIQFSPNRKIDLWIRVARTIQRDAKTIGSGNELINGNQRTDVVVQFRYKF